MVVAHVAGSSGRRPGTMRIMPTSPPSRRPGPPWLEGRRSGTEEGDISPVFAALEHAAGDFTTLGKNPLLEGSSPPSDTFSNLFCKEAFRGRMHTAGLRIIVQGYSYRYRYRVLIGKDAGGCDSLQHTHVGWPEVPQRAGP